MLRVISYRKSGEKKTVTLLDVQTVFAILRS